MSHGTEAWDRDVHAAEDQKIICTHRQAEQAYRQTESQADRREDTG